MSKSPARGSSASVSRASAAASSMPYASSACSARAASNAPVFHLRKISGADMASSYLESFERVWDSATPCERQ